jgi:hypothetical protein
MPRMSIRSGCLALGTGAALAAAVAAPSAVVGQSIADPVGDGHGAPDVCVVAVSRGPAAVVFEIRFADRPSLEPGERVTLVLDTDRDRTTGNPDLGGADLLASYGTLGAQTFAGELVRWRRDRWEPFPDGSRDARFVPGRSLLRVVLARSAVRASGFRWSAVTFAAGRNRGSDVAPDDGMASYPAGGRSGDAEARCGPPSTPA